MCSDIDLKEVLILVLSKTPLIRFTLTQGLVRSSHVENDVGQVAVFPIVWTEIPRGTTYG